MLRLDGDLHEGGGQILRSCLSLSAVTGQPFTLLNIRRRRPTPGLKAQHLAGVHLVAAMCGAEVRGDALDSTELCFQPGPLQAGRFSGHIATAGAIPLLLQACLLPALLAPGPVELDLTGGTDVSWAPPLDYLSDVVFPYYRLLGEIRETVTRRGFFPKGKGKLTVQVRPRFASAAAIGSAGRPADLVGPVPWDRIRAWAVASEELRDRQVAERLLKGAQRELSHLALPVQGQAEYVRTASIGCVVTLVAEAPEGAWPRRLGADRLGRRGVPAEEIGAEAGRDLAARLGHPNPVEEHLTDQLLTLLGLCGGALATQTLSPHTLANRYVVETFLQRPLQIDEKEAIIRV